MSADQGDTAAGFTGNFDYGTLQLGSGAYVRLVDSARNSTSTSPEALYVNTLIVPSGTTLDLNGLNLYTRVSQINGTIIGGTIQTLPSGGALTPNTTVPGTISTPGEVDTWTFYGWAGHGAAVVINPGSGTPAPLAPDLNDATVELIDPTGQILGTVTTATSGESIAISGVTLPSDGTYQIVVQAAPGHAADTGHYLISEYDSTVRTANLVLGQPYTGTLVTPYDTDHWDFTASANDEVQFSLLNATSPGLSYQLSGPDGFVVNQVTAVPAGLINLPATGAYTLTVSPAGGQPGSYALRIDETTRTTLTLGSTYQGTLAGTGQVQVFQINVPMTQDLLVSLVDSTPADINDLYLRFGSPPTPGDYQYHGSSSAPGGLRILVPSAYAGTWYALVYSDSVACAKPVHDVGRDVAPVSHGLDADVDGPERRHDAHPERLRLRR